MVDAATQQKEPPRQGRPPVAPTAAARPLTAPPPSKLDYRLLFRWAREAIAGMTWPVVALTALGMFTALLSQYSGQLLINLISMLEKLSNGTTAAPAQPSGSGLIGSLLPADAATSALLLAATSIILIGLGFANRVSSVWLNSKMIRRIQLRVHDKLLAMGPGYHGKHDMGENTALVTQFVQAAQPTLRDVLSFPLERGVALLGAFGFLFYNLWGANQQVILYAVLAALLIVLPAGSVWLAGEVRNAFTEVRERQSALSNTLVDSLTAPQEVQLMAAGAQRSSAFSAALESLGLAQLRATIRNETSGQFQAAVPTLLQVGLLLWVVFGAGGAAIGAVLAIYRFVPDIVRPIQELLSFYNRLASSWPQVEKVGQILDASPEVADTGVKTAADLPDYALQLENVTFKPEDRTIIDDLSYAFAPGKITALVGRSGSGKSTIFRMISRLFDPTSGRITIGGVDVRDLKLAELRSVIATVSQFPLFIEGTARQNLALGNADATDEDMKRACVEADIWEALLRISPSDPLAAPVPRLAGKVGLAGGERRRLSIARTLLSDAPILLLDEPTTGIDVLSVSKIMDVLRAVPGRTILIIDHKIELFRTLADVVCCLENGKFDVGTPDELLKRPSLFKALLEGQESLALGGNLEVTATVPVRPAIATVAGKPPPSAAQAPAPGQNQRMQ